MTAKRPNSMRHLDDAIRRECGGNQAAYVRLRTLMANAVVAGMLPDGVVKGGSAIKMRYGNARTRYTTDLDTATATDPASYADLLGAALARGWEGFTGRVVPREPAHPKDVPEEYVMRPFDVRLSYLGKPWCTVPLEVGHDEIGDADAADWIDLEDADAAFAALGLPSPGRAPLMTLEHQVAQKLHAVTGTGDRVRDLVDLQVMFSNSDIDLAATKRTCERLFAYRQRQACGRRRSRLARGGMSSTRRSPKAWWSSRTSARRSSGPTRSSRESPRRSPTAAAGPHRELSPLSWT